MANMITMALMTKRGGIGLSEWQFCRADKECDLGDAAPSLSGKLIGLPLWTG